MVARASSLSSVCCHSSRLRFSSSSSALPDSSRLSTAALTFAACQESLEEKAAREAELYTKKNCPSLIAKNMTMDSLTFEANTHTLHFYYTLSGEADTVGVMNQIDAKTLLLSELKNTTAMLAYKDAGYNFAYTYHSQKNPQVVIFQTVFSEKDYKAEAPAQKD